MNHLEQATDELLSDYCEAMDRYWAKVLPNDPNRQTNPKLCGTARILSGPKGLNVFILEHVAKVLRARVKRPDLPTTVQHFVNEVGL
jgi:hypothetical protein